MAEPNTQPPSPRSNEPEPSTTNGFEDHIVIKLEQYESYNWMDDELWEQFQEDFSEFTEEIFKNCTLQILRQLRIFLRTRGVKVIKNRHVTLARSLLQIIQEEEPAN